MTRSAALQLHLRLFPVFSSFERDGKFSYSVKIFTCFVFLPLCLPACLAVCLSVSVAGLVEKRVGHLPDRAQLVVMAASPRLAGSTQSPGDRGSSSVSSRSITHIHICVHAFAGINTQQAPIIMSTFTRGLIVMDKRSSLFFLKTELHRKMQILN